MAGGCVYCVLTWDDGHYDHVEHVVQQQRDGHRHQHQLPLVGALLQRVPPLLPVLADGLVAGQEGDVGSLMPMMVGSLCPWSGLNIVVPREPQVYTPINYSGCQCPRPAPAPAVCPPAMTFGVQSLQTKLALRQNW